MERVVYIETKATIAVIEPGDMTRYEFIWANAQLGYVHIASIGSVRFDGYQYETLRILHCYNLCKDCAKSGSLPADPDDHSKLEPYLSYITEHSNCNPWTAWAMVQCLAERWISNQVEEKR